MNGTSCLQLHSGQKDPEQRLQAYAIQAFEHIRAILQTEPNGKVLIQIVIPSRETGQLFRGLSGLLKNVRLETPNILGQLIEVEDDHGLSDKLKENSRRPEQAHIRYQDGKRLVAFWEKVRASQDEVTIPWKERGIYLIIGDAGGLDLVVAKEIADKTKNVTLILGNLSELSEGKRTKLEELKNTGAAVERKAVNICEKESVKELIKGVQNTFGGLNGIIHIAEVIRKQNLLRMSREERQVVMESGLSGVVNLDLATKDLRPDFYLLFSTTTGPLRNRKQADDTTANAFIEAYAMYRNDLVASKKRRGSTLSINWALSQEGGMPIDDASETKMSDDGMAAMQTSSGIEALYQAFAIGKPRVMVLEGNSKSLQSYLTVESIKKETLIQETNTTHSRPASADGDLLEEKALQYLLLSRLKEPRESFQLILHLPAQSSVRGSV